MKWRAQSNSEAGEILKLLARQGEPLLKKLDQGVDLDLLSQQAKNDETPVNSSTDVGKKVSAAS